MLNKYNIHYNYGEREGLAELSMYMLWVNVMDVITQYWMYFVG